MINFKKTFISLGLVASMLASSPLGTVKAAADGEGKYVSEVYVAYGNSEEEASQWLKDNGWEPVAGNFGSGKERQRATVMGIHRTGNPSDAITDMAVMNMKGGYSFDMYSELVKEKKVEIDAMLDSFQPVIEEFRANYNGEGSEEGRKRAEYVCNILNHFYDGDPEDRYAVNDTGKPLGDLFLSTTKRELGDDAYEALSAEDKKKYGDTQQIILESMPETSATITQIMAIATDTNETTWLERLSSVQGEDLLNEIELYVEEATPDMSQSAAESLLASRFEDTAVTLSSQWDDIHEQLVWFNEFSDAHQLSKLEGETDEEYTQRYDEFLTQTEENDSLAEDKIKFENIGNLAAVLLATEYSGEWGDTLYDFFAPENGASYQGDIENFSRFAAVLSDGQRAGLNVLSLETLLRTGYSDDAVYEDMKEKVKNIGGIEEPISVYAGMDRAIFRDGVALTNEALAASNTHDLYDYNEFDVFKTLTQVCSIGCVASLTCSIITGALVKSAKKYAADKTGFYKLVDKIVDEKMLEPTKIIGESVTITLEDGTPLKINNTVFEKIRTTSEKAEAALKSRYSALYYFTELTVVLGLIVFVISMVNIFSVSDNKYNSEFTKIPLMMVDETDIVSYKTDANGKQLLDENGKPIKDINFDQFLYYRSVACNRQEIEKPEYSQKGVDKYKEWLCGDAADLNADVGKEWLALYTNKSSAKGNPILADSLTVQYGSNALPENCTKSLHTFRNTYAFNVANETYSFSDDMNGIYLFWADDPTAYGTAASAAGSVFGTGLAALFGVGGLGLGVLGTMLVMMPKRKKEETNSVSIA